MTSTPAGHAPAAPRPVTPVGILARRLRDLAAVLDADVTGDARVRDEVVSLAALAAGIEPYSELNTTGESEALAALAARTRLHDWSADAGGGLEQEMLSGHVEGQLLKMLVAATGARHVLEIGMFTGYATLAMAEAVPAGGRVVACEIDAGVASLARESFAGSVAGSRIEVRVGPAAATLAALATDGARFDLVFLDADKGGYAGYVEQVLSLGLLAEDGLLCVDNTLLQGEPWTGAGSVNGAAVAEFNAWLRHDPRVEQVLVPVRDGLTLARWATAGPA